MRKSICSGFRLFFASKTPKNWKIAEKRLKSNEKFNILSWKFHDLWNFRCRFQKYPFSEISAFFSPKKSEKRWKNLKITWNQMQNLAHQLKKYIRNSISNIFQHLRVKKSENRWKTLKNAEKHWKIYKKRWKVMKNVENRWKNTEK